MIAALRNRLRWTANRARYVAATEGTGTLVRRMAAMAGVSTREETPEQVLVRPPALPLRAAVWPRSVLLLSPPADGSAADARFRRRAEHLRALGLPVLSQTPGGDAAISPLAELASTVLVHPRSWSTALPAVLDTAARLRQGVIWDLDATDVGIAPPPRGVGIIVESDQALGELLRAWSRSPHEAAAPRVVPPADGPTVLMAALDALGRPA